MNCKVKDLKVGMVVIGTNCDYLILSFEKSRFQKNGKELRVAKVKSYGKLPYLNDYMKFCIDVTYLGKMETFKTISDNNQFPPKKK